MIEIFILNLRTLMGYNELYKMSSCIYFGYSFITLIPILDVIYYIEGKYDNNSKIPSIFIPNFDNK